MITLRPLIRPVKSDETYQVLLDGIPIGIVSQDENRQWIGNVSNLPDNIVKGSNPTAVSRKIANRYLKSAIKA